MSPASGAAAPKQPAAARARKPALQSVGIALGVLEALAVAPELSLSELARRVGVAKSTAHRTCSVLTDSGMLTRTDAGKYRLGLRLIELGQLATARTSVGSHALPLLVDLRHALGETVQIGVPAGGDVVYVERVEGNRALRYANENTRRGPVHRSSCGKVLAAYIPAVLEARLEKGLPPTTGYTIVVPDVLRTELEKVRRQGYAKSVDETEIGMASMAVPVRSTKDGPVVAAISMVGPTSRVVGDSETSNVATLKAASRKLTELLELGDYRLPAAPPDELIVVGGVQYDYVIVGGGSAGCALANRLSADPSNRVLVLEAGRTDWKWDVFIHMPAALTYPIGSRFYDWKYESEPEPFMGGRRVYHARGKVLGGSSSINGMIFQRGNPADYAKWAERPGMADWSYAHCLPYFKRMETCLAGGDDWRGDDGPLELERGPATNPLFQAWLAAGEQAGFRRTDDVNGYRQEGFAAFDKNVRRGRRLSAARAYLHPVLDRPNLDLITRAQVNRIVFDGTRATAVEYRRNRKVHAAEGAEIILCGGAFNSPQLLQLSGIGDPAHLEPLGVEMVHALPGVGENMQDHLEVYIQHACTQPVSMQKHLATWRMPIIGLQWLFRKGPAATNHFEAGAFLKSNADEPYPNLMYHFLPIAIRYDGSAPTSGTEFSDGYQVHVGPMFSESRGTVKIRSTDPREHPAVLFNYLSTERDRREWIEAVRVTRHILAQPAFAPYDGGEISPGPSVETDEEIMGWVARDAETALHPSCTCAMGTGEMDVVDPATFRVHGVDGLRVVDASVLPIVTNGNIYAPTMMVAERAADAILGNGLLPPSTADVYLPEPR